MKSTIKQKLSLIFISIVFVASLIAIIILFILIKPRLKRETINKYSKYVIEVENVIKINMSKNLALGRIIASNLSTFYSGASNMNLSDEYLNLISKDILTQNDYILAIGYVINAENMFFRLTSEEYVDSNGIYHGLWYKDFNQQVNISKFELKKFNNPHLFLEAKSSRQPVAGVPTIYTLQGENILAQPLAFPIYVGDQYMGIVVIFVSSKFINPLFAYLNLPSGTQIFISTEKGLILNEFPESQQIGQNLFKLYPFLVQKTYRNLKAHQPIQKEYHGKFYIINYVLISPQTFWLIGLTFPAPNISSLLIKTIAFLVLVAFLVSFIIYFIFRMLTMKLSSVGIQIQDNILELYQGKINAPIPQLEYFYEIQVITQALEKLRQRLVEIAQAHEKIRNREYDFMIQPNSDSDKLAESINTALQELNERKKSSAVIEQQQKRHEWINTGLAKIYEATRIEENSLDLLSSKSLQALIDYTKAFLGGIFLLDENNKKLILTAAFAYDNPKVIKQEIELGQGIVGAVALERKPQYITNVPEDYKVIVFGLGETKPKSILIQPLIYEEELLGVIELAFIHKLEDYEIEFIDKASFTIAQSIKTIKVNLQTEKLLTDLRQQTAELERVKQLLQQQVKELEEREKVLKMSQAEMKGILDAINNTLLTVVYTVNGEIITANELFSQVMEYTLDEIIGLNVLELAGDQKEELAKILKDVAQGKHVEKIVKRYTKFGKVRWLYATYTPFYDIEGKITKILFFAFDITETYTRIQQLETEVQNLKKQIELLDKALQQTTQ